MAAITRATARPMIVRRPHWASMLVAALVGAGAGAVWGMAVTGEQLVAGPVIERDLVPACTDAIADAGGICIGEPADQSAVIELPPCPTEDSDQCIWSADEQGNGVGSDFIRLNGTTYLPEGD
jgi:hypothetical protein